MTRSKKYVYRLIAATMIKLLATVGVQASDTVVVRVQDSSGTPLKDASVTMSISQSGNKRPTKTFSFTNSSGNSVFLKKSGLNIGVIVEKQGFYKSRQVRQHQDGQMEFDIFLKPKLSPVALYAKNISIFPPELNTPIGFDFLISDWTKPHGEGLVADVFFEMSHERFDEGAFIQTLALSFDRNKSGIYQLTRDRGRHQSDFPYIYLAPESGYTEKFVGAVERTQTESNDNFKDKVFTVLRTRVVEKDDVIISAHYTKIYPQITLINGMTDRPGFAFTYYYNPNPNDRNLEFDVDSNLFRKLPYENRVFKP